MKNTLEIDSVILEFGLKRILQDVYLKIETGRITGLLGRNGTGKSSLMKIIFGELVPESKSIRINDEALLNSYRSPEVIRYLPQNNFIPKALTVGRVFRDFNIEWQELVGEFPSFANKCRTKLGNLSGGERRIIEIYSIVVSDAKFCMLDEPFSQVMPIHVETLKRIILRERNKKGIILTDHLYKHIVEICDDLYVISQGKTYLTRTIDNLEGLGYIRNIN